MQPKKITIHDVARHAKVSVSTVSLVLSGKGRISKSTIERVNQSIELLGYSRNRQASMLRGGESGVIGLIVHNVTDPFYAELTSGVSNMLERHNRMLFLTQSHRDSEKLNKCFNTLCEQGVDGIILGGVKHDIKPLEKRARELNIPLVCAAKSSSLDTMDVIRPDNTLAAKLATEFLVNRGHRQIAYIGGNSGSLMRAERLGGFCATLIQYGVPFRDDWIIECDNQPSAAANIAESLLIHFPKISAIICDNTSISLGVYFGVLRTGRTIGNEALDNYYQSQVALVSFGEAPESGLTEPPLTFVSNSAKEIGQHAAERIIQRLSDPTLPPQHIILPPAVINHHD